MNGVIQGVEAPMAGQESKALRGDREQRDRLACVEKLEIRELVAVMERPDDQVFYFVFIVTVLSACVLAWKTTQLSIYVTWRLFFTVPQQTKEPLCRPMFSASSYQ